MASRSALLALLVVVSSVAAASAATSFTVGDSSGWTLTGVNYDTWASGKTFTAGDSLVFNFATGSHDVVEVDKNAYDSCSTSNAIKTIQTGPATVALTAGTHYYICGFSGHCSAGMKLAVTVGSGSGSSPSTPPTPGAGTPPTTPSAPAPASASVRLAAGPALAVAAAVLVKLALF